MHAWIHMIVMKGLPFSCVADKDFRAIVKPTTQFGISTNAVDGHMGVGLLVAIARERSVRYAYE
jgi:hypothetical protein